MADKKKPQQEEEEFTPEDFAAAQAAEEPVSEEELLAAAQDAEPPLSPAERLRAAGTTTRGQAFGRHFLQGGTARFSDEILGGLSAALGPAAMDTPGELADRWASILNGGGGGMPGDSERPKGYKENRDAYRALNAKASADRPRASLAGDLTGGVLLTKGLPTGYGSAAVQGAVTGLGGSDAEGAGGMAADSAIGAGFGLAGNAIGNGLGRVAAKYGPTALRALRALGDKIAVSQGRRVLLNGADSLSNRLPTAADAVLEAIDSKAIVPFGTTQGAFKRLERLAEERGAAYGAVLHELEASGVKGPQAEALAAQLTERGRDLLTKTGADKAVPSVFLDEAANLRSIVPEGETALGLTQAEQVKRALQQAARYGRFETTPVNEAKKEVAAQVRQAIEDAVQKAGQEAPEGSTVQTLSEGFVPLKQRLSRTLEARAAAERGASRVAQRRGMSLSDYMAAGMGSGLDEKVTFATLNNFARNRGTSAVASGARGLANLAGAGAHAATRNPRGVVNGTATLSRALSPDIADLLGFGPDEQPDETQAALIEALRRRQESAQ